MKNFFLACRESRIEPSSPSLYYGSFYVGPFENGQALTIANALRRTLLSEIPGLGITAVKMGGVFHEYSNLVGMRENVMDVLLNFKEIVLKKTTSMPSSLPSFQKNTGSPLASKAGRAGTSGRAVELFNESREVDSRRTDSQTKNMHEVQSSDSLTQTQMGYLQVRGPGTVRAADLQLPPTLECVDPDQYICTLNEQGSLNVIFIIEEGKNFLFRKNKIDFFNLERMPSFPGQFLPIDPVFSPIKRVNYSIQNYSSETVYKSNQFVILEIWTNGSLSPKQALSQALNFLRFVFSELGKLEVLNSISNRFFLSEDPAMSQAFRDIDRDLDFFEYNLYKQKLVLTRPSLPSFHDFDSETSVSSTQQNVLKNNGTDLSAETPLAEFGLPFLTFKALYGAKILKVEHILKFTTVELQQILSLDKFAFEQLIQTLNKNNVILD